MSYTIERVAVIGAGTMGAAIAAHAANAGLPVLLLDIVPRELTEKEEAAGLGLDHPAVRNRIAAEGLERIARLKPASFMSRKARALVEIGNLEDDFERLAEADWIVEAVVEKLEIKRSLFERLDPVRFEGGLVTTNTSGLPIDSIIEGRSESLRRSFFGTHFFNPPRYMKLLEIIRGRETDPAAVEAFAEFAARRLGKGVVFAKDTPNFIGNRLLSIHGSHTIAHALDAGYSLEEVDAVTGPLIGRPKTATFRLQDLVGIDVSAYVGQNLHGLIPEDPYRDLLVAPTLRQVVGGLMERGRLGNKTKAGFYRKTKDAAGKRVFEVLDPATFEYRAPEKVRLESLAAAGRIPDLGERLRTLFSERWREDRGARLAWEAVAHLLEYSAAVAREIAYDLPSIDRAVRWGFSYEAGPFELWDLLGVAATAERMNAEGRPVAPWVEEMLAAGCESFYRREDGRIVAYYDWEAKAYAELPRDPRELRVVDLAGSELVSNDSAALFDLGEGVLLLEFHGKMNAIDDQVVAMMGAARERLEEDRWAGLVIGNDGENFCVGANLLGVVTAAGKGDLEAVEAGIRALQEALQAFRFSPKPVVAAVHGMALGGGAEIALAAQRVVAAAESYIGLVEVGVGLLPAGGGMKEMVRRVLGPAMDLPYADPLPAAQKVFQIVGMAKVSTSAAEAAETGFLTAGDPIVMKREHLLWDARAEVLQMAAEGHRPPAEESLHAGGRDLYATLKLGLWAMAQGGYTTPHDSVVGEKVAFLIAGGDASAAGTASEQHFLDLERRAFLELLATEATQARIRHMLETGKPLRN